MLQEMDQESYRHQVFLVGKVALVKAGGKQMTGTKDVMWTRLTRGDVFQIPGMETMQVKPDYQISFD